MGHLVYASGLVETESKKKKRKERKANNVGPTT